MRRYPTKDEEALVEEILTDPRYPSDMKFQAAALKGWWLGTFMADEMLGRPHHDDEEVAP
jgi:hypothetical protein